MGAESSSSFARKVVAVIGANGMLARMVRERAPQDYVLHLYDLPDFDLTSREQVFKVIKALAPEVIINCAAFTRVDECESNQELANRVNGLAVGFLADIAKTVDAILVQVSTDYVFDGTQTMPYSENDPTNPKSAYGMSKLIGEQSVETSSLTKYFIVRTSWLYGPGGNNFVETILRLAAERQELRIVADQVGSPTYTADLADAIFQLLRLADLRPADSVPWGLYHFANAGRCSWHEFACAIIEEAHAYHLPVTACRIHPIATEEYPLPAPRPSFSVLDTSRYRAKTGAAIPGWRESLKHYFSCREHK